MFNRKTRALEAIAFQAGLANKIAAARLEAEVQIVRQLTMYVELALRNDRDGQAIRGNADAFLNRVGPLLERILTPGAPEVSARPSLPGRGTRTGSLDGPVAGDEPVPDRD